MESSFKSKAVKTTPLTKLQNAFKINEEREGTLLEA